MRIALVHSYYSRSSPSGENTVVDAQAAALVKAGHEVLVVSRETDEEAASPLYAARAAFRVASGRGSSPRSALDQFAPEVVHVHNLFPNFSVRWVDDWPGPIVATVHNFRAACAAGTFFRDGKVCHECLESSPARAVRHHCYRNSALATLPLAAQSLGGFSRDVLLRRADALVALCPRTKRLLTGQGLEAEKVRVIPNFSDLQLRSVVQRGPWVFAGRLSPEKGLTELLAHWPVDKSLTVLGDGPLRQEAQALAGASVRFMGNVDKQTLGKHLERATGVVIPSIWPESAYPMAYTEAIARGVPCVAKVGNAAADDIVEYGSGATFRVWDELPTALHQVEQNHVVVAAAAGARARELSEPNWVRDVTKLYEAVTRT